MTRYSVFAAGEVTLHSLQESGHLEEISLLSSKIVPHFFSVINVGCDPLEDHISGIMNIIHLHYDL